MARLFWTRPFYQVWMACSEGTIRQQEWGSFFPVCCLALLPHRSTNHRTSPGAKQLPRLWWLLDNH